MRKFWDEPDGEDKSGYDEAYVFNRDAPHRSDVREFVEDLYQRYTPYCGDPDFARKMRHEFNACTWQMYSGVCLQEAGHVLEKADAEGPDHKLLAQGRRVWGESIAREPGGGSDRPERKISFKSEVKEHKFDGGTIRSQHAIFRPDDKGIALRLTGAIWEKVKQHKKWVADGAISADDPYVICVGAGLIQDADLHGEFPRIVQVLFGFDDLAMIMKPYSEEPPEVVPTYREEIRDSSGRRIPMRGFLDPNLLPEVSAVIFCPHGAWNPPRSIGRDLVTVYNSVARHRLEPGFMPRGREYFVENDKLKKLDHREAIPDPEVAPELREDAEQLLAEPEPEGT